MTLQYVLPRQVFHARDASVFVTATDFFLFTNYTGLDPIVNGNTRRSRLQRSRHRLRRIPDAEGLNFGSQAGLLSMRCYPSLCLIPDDKTISCGLVLAS